jgi:hypothetical protein
MEGNPVNRLSQWLHCRINSAWIPTTIYYARGGGGVIIQLPAGKDITGKYHKVQTEKGLRIRVCMFLKRLVIFINNSVRVFPSIT